MEFHYILSNFIKIIMQPHGASLGVSRRRKKNVLIVSPDSKNVLPQSNNRHCSIHGEAANQQEKKVAGSLMFKQLPFEEVIFLP